MSHPPEDILGPRKRKPVPVDPLNAEAERLDIAAARKKARLELDQAKKVLVAKAKNTGNKETVPAKPTNRAQRQPSIEVVEDADEVQSRQRIPPKNPKNILESDDDEPEDDEPDHMATSSKRSNMNKKRYVPSDVDDTIRDTEDDDIPESPEESAEAELRESHFLRRKAMH